MSPTKIFDFVGKCFEVLTNLRKHEEFSSTLGTALERRDLVDVRKESLVSDNLTHQHHLAINTGQLHLESEPLHEEPLVCFVMVHELFDLLLITESLAETIFEFLFHALLTLGLGHHDVDVELMFLLSQSYEQGPYIGQSTSDSASSSKFHR